MRIFAAVILTNFVMKHPSMTLVAAAAACMFAGCTEIVPPTGERVLELIEQLPDHGITPGSESSFTPDYFALLTEAWDIPGDYPGGIGTEEWLYYFVSGNGDYESMDIDLRGIKGVNEEAEAQYMVTYNVGTEYADSTLHTLKLAWYEDRWVIADYDSTLMQLGSYIETQRAYFQSPEYHAELEREVKDQEITEEQRAEHEKMVAEYFEKY